MKEEEVTDSPLATFDSPHAIRHVRTYPHPVDLVWEAVTTAEHLNAWMLPVCTVERRLGGKATFTWGGTDPGDEAIETEIIEWDPPRVVDYRGLRFELEPVDGGNSTRLTFIQSFPPDIENPWRSDFCAGFHIMLDRIPDFLDGTWGLDDTMAELALMPDGTEEYRRLSKRYETEVLTLRPAR